MDLVFVVDRGVSSTNWNTMISFIISILNQFEIGDSAARIGFITFANSAQSEFFLNTYNNREDVIAKIQSISSSSEAETNTQAAVSLARTSQFTSANGDRSSAKNILVYVTDSASTTESSSTLSEASSLKTNGVTILSIGVGESSTLITEIGGIASQPQTEDAFYWVENTFSALAGITNGVAAQISSVANSRYFCTF